MVAAPPTPTHFVPVLETTADLIWTKLKTIDLSRYDEGPTAQMALAQDLKAALHDQGFFYLVNHGFDQEEMTRINDIGYTVMSNTSLEEKTSLQGRMQEMGSYNGFKLLGYWNHHQDVNDRIEQFNWNRKMAQQFPDALQPYLLEVARFTRRMHEGLLFKILRLCALGLELPIETFVDKHKFDVDDESWFRWMAYYDAFSKEEETKAKGLWLPGHTDLTSISVLFSQPMACLQVKESDGSWSNVKHEPGAMIINVGQLMHWYTGGYYKAAVHRVAAPPDDQRNHVRFGCFYFAVPNNNEICETLMSSPVLRNAEEGEVVPLETPVLAGEYVKSRIAGTGKTQLFNKKPDENGVVYEIIAGVKTPWYRN